MRLLVNNRTMKFIFVATAAAWFWAPVGWLVYGDTPIFVPGTDLPAR